MCKLCKSHIRLQGISRYYYAFMHMLRGPLNEAKHKVYIASEKHRCGSPKCLKWISEVFKTHLCIYNGLLYGKL